MANVVARLAQPALEILRPDLWNAEKYHKHSDQQKMVAEKLIQQHKFSDIDHLLDIGCGDGKITVELAKKIPNGQVIGMDPSESMINFANKQFSEVNLSFLKGKASELAFDHRFNVITSFSSLHWEPNQKEALLCFRRALMPGGTILLAIPGPDSVLRITLETICSSSKWKVYFENFQSPGRIWTANEYAQLLLDTNFIIQKLEVVHRPYVFQEEDQYKDFVEAMLPHMLRIPLIRQSEFLNEIICLVKEQRHVDEFGKLRFEVNVLEVIAHVPV